MKTLILALATAAVLTGCSALTPTLDKTTGTTLAERCVDYQLTMAVYEAITEGEDARELSRAEAALYTAASTFVQTNCPTVEVPTVAEPVTVDEPTTP